MGNLVEGVRVGEGLVRVWVPETFSVDRSDMDGLILGACKAVGGRVILVTMDVNLRIRADCMGIQVARYESQSVGGQLWNGWEDSIEGSEEELWGGIEVEGYRENGGVDMQMNKIVVVCTHKKVSG
jgi:predicted ribonuclease YlaK